MAKAVDAVADNYPANHTSQVEIATRVLRGLRPSEALTLTKWLISSTNSWCPRRDSNARTRLRRPLLYPLSYEGGVVGKVAENLGTPSELRGPR